MIGVVRAIVWLVMPASTSTEFVATQFDDQQRRHLLTLARYSIESGCQNGRLAEPNADAPAWLQQEAACFVTLTAIGNLRGCIGSLWPRRSLASDVTENAFAAAFRDPRFPPVQLAELASLCIEIAVLSAPAALPSVSDEQALLSLLRPDVDGVVLEQSGRRATFLPKVWSHFDEPTEFLAALRQKAGLPTAFDPAARYSVYQVTAFAELP